MSTVTEYPCRKAPEIWGGIECTINRVQHEFRDQLEYSGHYTRADDIEKFADLQISKLRYPILWERHQPNKNETVCWNWANKQLDLIQKNKITPIAGLLHHGSGPCYTDLLDKDFAGQLAAYAGQVASRFPWLEYYTPVNEPLTTARFSGLYGFWYPHHKNELSFMKMLLNQVKGIVLSMKAIHRINPDAKLVQTEDLAKTHSSPLLSYQADFENERRWLTNDLLCGKLDKGHYFWNYLTALGIEERDLAFFLENKCPPYIQGFNYYATSERWLDEEIHNYSVHSHGSNGKHFYVDTEAVRVGQMSGLRNLLSEAWYRYQLPIAITECHLSCTKEEQMRWLKQTWDTCCALKEEGIDLRAMTAWSLLGAYDWNSLLTGYNSHYESGVFDVRDNKLRPTALVKLVHSLKVTGGYSHPLLNQKGWWDHRETSLSQTGNRKHSPLLILGSRGTLGHAFTRICDQRSIPYIALSRKELNIVDKSSIEAAIEKYNPWALINAAGYVRVDDAELNRDECFSINATAPGILAGCCLAYGIQFMTFSSDLVFDGVKKTPYHETDITTPLNTYGESKAKGEELVWDSNPDSLIIRTSAFFGPWDRYNFAFTVLDSLKHGREFSMPYDVIVSPTYIPDLAGTALDLLIDEEKGIWHLTNTGRLTWANFAEAIAERARYKKDQLVSKSLREMGWKAKRPLYSVLESEKGVNMPSFDNALQRFFDQRMI